jgi:hypothetical protein
MLTFSAPQVTSLRNQRHQAFLDRMNLFLSKRLGAPWEGIEARTRLKRLSSLCEQGFALGVQREIDLAQFMVMLIFTGEGFLKREDVQAIVYHSDMSWGEKLFQLMFLAGIDLSSLPAQRV